MGFKKHTNRESPCTKRARERRNYHPRNDDNCVRAFEIVPADGGELFAFWLSSSADGRARRKATLLIGCQLRPSQCQLYGGLLMDGRTHTHWSCCCCVNHALRSAKRPSVIYVYRTARTEWLIYSGYSLNSRQQQQQPVQGVDNSRQGST